MIGVIRAEAARTVRRVSVWVLTACAVSVAVLVAAHNVEQARIADERLAYAQGSYVLNGCIMYVDGTPSGFCPGAAQPPPSTFDPGTIAAQPVTGDPQEFIDAAIAAAESDVSGVHEALGPPHRADLAIALLGSAPGIALAVLLGALIAGSDYAWGTARANLLAARSRGRLLAGRVALLWILALVWILLGTLASWTTYAALAKSAGLPALGPPRVSIAVLAGAWLSLGMFASIGAALAMVLRSALGGAATGLGIVTALRLVPQTVGVDLGRLDILRSIARVLSPEPAFSSSSSSIAVTATLGLPATSAPDGFATTATPSLVAGLTICGLAVIIAAWVIAMRQEVR